MRQCEKCDRETAHRVCGLCRFDAARQVPADVVQQLKQEAERQEATRGNRKGQTDSRGRGRGQERDREQEPQILPTVHRIS